MTAEYAEPDREVVDYEPYCLDPLVLDRQTGVPLMLRGPAPDTLETGQYFVCLGAAQTFGRFCLHPFPALLQSRLGMPGLNLGRGGAGPSFFLGESGRLLDYVNRARFAIVQVMAGRSESNSLFESKGLGYYTRRSNGQGIGCDEAFREVLATGDRALVDRIVGETRRNWVASYLELLAAITVPKILFWFAGRGPSYTENHRDLEGLFSEFPQLVNADMIQQVAPAADRYVECVSASGLPQRLVSRITGRAVVVSDPWGAKWRENWYYPSPEMHSEACRVLEPAARGLMGREGGSRWFVGDVRQRSIVEPAPVRTAHASRQRNRIGAFLRHVPFVSTCLGGRSRYVRFIILGRGRTGSNFLRGLLNSHRSILTFGELFRSDDSIGWELPLHDRYLQSRHLVALMQADPVRFLEEKVFRPHSRRIAAVGFKLFYYHARDDARRALWDHLRDHKAVRIIHLKRQNTLRMILSEKKAFATDLWTNTTGMPETPFSVTLDHDECRWRFEHESAVAEKVDEFFREHPKITLNYEQLAADWRAEMTRVLEFLGVDQDELSPSTYRQSRQPLAQMITNYAQLQEEFRGTAWGRFFDDA